MTITNDRILTQDVKDLIETANIGEDFDFTAKWKFVAREGQRLIGIIVYDLFEAQDITYPMIEHIIFHPKFQRTKSTIKFLRKTEELIVNEGYKQLLAYILNKKTLMVKLATKFGYIPYQDAGEGKMYYKNMGE